MKAALGIDAGASSTAWCLLAEDGLELAHGKAPPLTGHIFSDSERDLNLGHLRTIMREASAHGVVKAVIAGITGLHKDTEAQRAFTQEAARVLSLTPDNIYFDNDLQILYTALFEPGEGIVLYAGTGAVAYHETAQGKRETAGGYGYLVDDGGAGFWIGQQALRWLLREHDRSGVSDQLLGKELYSVLGSSHWPTMMEHIYSHGRAGVTALVLGVSRAADQGDEAALAILVAAAKELADLLRRLQLRLNKDLPIAFAGGLSNSEHLVHALRLELAEIPFEVANIQAERAAAKLALERLA